MRIERIDIARRLDERFHEGDLDGFQAFELDVRPALQKLSHLSPDWDGYGAVPPNRRALLLADEVLTVLGSFDLLRADVEGGVVAFLGTGARYSSFSVDNDGDIVLALVDDATGAVQTFDVSLHGLEAQVNKARRWLDG